MLLTETINNSISTIENRRIAVTSKQQSEIYMKALMQLSKAVKDIDETLDCATAMKDSGIINTPFISENTRSDLLSCIDDCGNGVSEMQLTLDTVKLLKSKGDSLAAEVKIAWQDASQKYSEGSKGYLSTIGVLSDNPKRARDISDSITKTVAGAPSIKAVNNLVSDVAEAKRIVDKFSLSPEIENFLKKVSTRNATVSDLTPNILEWIKKEKLTSKLKIQF